MLLAAGIKFLSQWLLVRKDPEVTLSTLVGWRYVPFLLHSLATTGVVGIRWSDAGRAWQMLPLQAFLFTTKVVDWLPIRCRGTLLLEPEYGRPIQSLRTVDLEGKYYSSLAHHEAGQYTLPYFCHASVYTSGLIEVARLLAGNPPQKTTLLFFSGSSCPFYERLNQAFHLLSREQIMTALEETLCDQSCPTELKESAEIKIIRNQT